ncbi:MAG: permease [Campylobacterota bacterium]|nr:permease [Campylobacterota bacterium]
MKKFEFKGIKFLAVVIILYFTAFVFNFEQTYLGLLKAFDIFLDLLPIFVFIIILTACINYFLKPKQLMKHFGQNSGKKGVAYSLTGGILSHGPMYAWYGMLSQMREHGVKDGLIATFFYARAVKLPLLPFMLDLFGIVFTVIINVYILIFAIVQGKMMDKLMKES